MKPLSECRILLVDDTKANLDVLVAGLKGEYKLSVALNGELALSLASRIAPDLVLLDVMMPGLDGYEVCRRLRASPETADVPIIFVSALDEVQNKALGFELGANDYITKPFHLVEVKARVRSLLKAKAYNDRIKEQMAEELRVAREIQMGMLPRDFADLESTHGVKLAARLTPAGEVGGDLFAVFNPSPERLVLVIGDVSGKGIPAALFMVRTLSMIRLLARDIAAPEQILARLNDELAGDNPSSMFVTLACAVYEPPTRRLILSSGGQTRPLLLRKDAAPKFLLDHLGTALGLEPGMKFSQTALTLRPGDTLVFYTDGVTEAFNSAGDYYNNSRLLKCLASLANRDPHEVNSEIFQAVHEFAAGARQSDDIAVLSFQVAPGPESVETSSPPSKILEFAATRNDVMSAVEAVRDFSRDAQLTEEEIFAVALAVEECASNILQHACANDPSQTFQLAFACDGDTLTVLLSDPGVALLPEALERHGSERSNECGGWGLHLARSFLDNLEYARADDRNTWRLTKRLQRHADVHPH